MLVQSLVKATYLLAGQAGCPMGDVIQLNRYRKKRTRLARSQEAAENRARHGRSKPAKDSARREQERERLTLDAKLLEDKSDREGGPKQG